MDPLGELSPVAWEQADGELSQTVFVPGLEPGDALWVVEQGLRSRGVEIVVARLDRLTPVTFRRLKLAAETGDTRCLLLRMASALRETSWADLRVLVTPLSSLAWGQRRLQVEVLNHILVVHFLNLHFLMNILSCFCVLPLTLLNKYAIFKYF